MFLDRSSLPRSCPSCALFVAEGFASSLCENSSGGSSRTQPVRSPKPRARLNERRWTGYDADIPGDVRLVRANAATAAPAGRPLSTTRQAGRFGARSGPRPQPVHGRIDSLAARRRGEFRAPGCQSIREAGKTLIEGMESGSVRTRSGELYKPSAIRSYETCLRVHIYPDLGGAAVGDIRRRDVQALADRMLSGGANASTIRNALMPLRVIFRRLIEDDELTTNPCTGLRLPAVRGKRDRVASLDEAAHLIDALPTACYRALWATAFYVGLRLGELRGLRWEDVSLGENLIHVHRAIDQKGQVGTPKSAAGVPPDSDRELAALATSGAAHRAQASGDRIRVRTEPSSCALDHPPARTGSLEGGQAQAHRAA